MAHEPSPEPDLDLQLHPLSFSPSSSWDILLFIAFMSSSDTLLLIGAIKSKISHWEGGEIEKVGLKTGCACPPSPDLGLNLSQDPERLMLLVLTRF